MSRQRSLDENEQSFMHAQLMMATGLVAPMAPPRRSLLQTHPLPQQDPVPPWSLPSGNATIPGLQTAWPTSTPSSEFTNSLLTAPPTNAKRSRRRASSNRTTPKRESNAQPWPAEATLPQWKPVQTALLPRKPAQAPLLPGKPLEATLPPRKSAYVAQKEQRQALVDEARELEAHVDELRFRIGLPTQADRRHVAQAKAFSADLDEKMHDTRRHMIKLKSEVMKELRFPVVNTLVTHIHLPCDMDRRRAILQNLKDVKIRRAADLGFARFQHLDHHTPYLSQELFMTEDASFHCHRWELLAFPNFTSARQMFDALFFFVYNMEISVTEMVNQVAVREDDEDIEPTIWNHRMVTTTEDIGCLEELNMVGFAHVFDQYESLDGGPLGVIVIETVDEDDLYPYVPEDRVRKNFQSFFLFCEAVDPVTQHKSIVLKTCLICEQLPPEFPLDPALLAKLHEYTPRWMKLMNQYLRDYTVPETQ